VKCLLKLKIDHETLMSRTTGGETHENMGNGFTTVATDAQMY
jgi:hypothetical protein